MVVSHVILVAIVVELDIRLPVMGWIDVNLSFEYVRRGSAVKMCEMRGAILSVG